MLILRHGCRMGGWWLWLLVVVVLLLLLCDLSSSSSPSTLIGIVGRDYVVLAADTTHSGNGGIAVTSSDVNKIYKISDGPTHPMLAAIAGDLAHVQRFVHTLQAHAMMREYQDGIGNDVQYYNNNLDDDNKKEELGWNVAQMAQLARTQILPSCCMLLGGILHKKKEQQQQQQFLHQFQQQRNLQAQIQAAELDYQLNLNNHQDPLQNPASSFQQNQMDQQNNNDDEYHPQLYWLDETQCLIPQCDYSAHGYGSNFVLSILDRHYDPNATLDQAVQLINTCFQQLAQRYVLNSPKPHTIQCIQRDPQSGHYIIRTIPTTS